MHDFTFYNPTKILFGEGREREVADELERFGHQKVLVVCGGASAKKSGLLEATLRRLDGANVLWVLHEGVVSNPELGHTREGIAKARAHEVDAILAIGGGSVVDEAKAIALGVHSERDIWDYYEERLPITQALDLFVILTLAATGSEMNGNSVLTNEATHQKLSISSALLNPKVSFVNPHLMMSVPSNYIAYSAVDALTHILESYLTSRKPLPLQDALAEAVMKNLIDSCEGILEDRSAYEPMARFAWSATLALNRLLPAGIGDYSFPNHMIEHSLSALYNVPHGAGLAVVLPAWMEWYRERNLPAFERLERELRSGAELKAWFRKIGAPVSLKELGIAEGEIPRIIENILPTATRWGLHEYNAEALESILLKARA